MKNSTFFRTENKTSDLSVISRPTIRRFSYQEDFDEEQSNDDDDDDDDECDDDPDDNG